MDAFIYTAMSGAERALNSEQVHANNLANIGTGGFQADLEVAQSQTVTASYGYDDRHMATMSANAVSQKQGTLHETGRDLDVAVAGPGYIAVQYGDGEAYTRDGNMSVGQDGSLTIGGRPVMGDNGPVVLPQDYTQVQVSSDGSINVQEPGQVGMQVVDKLKLVKPDSADVTKNQAGLVVSRSGQTLATDDSVKVQSGHLESSNVSAIEEMISTMNVNRDFEVQMKLYRTADAMAEQGDQLVSGG